MKLYISKKQLKKTQEVAEFFDKKKAKDGMIKYKGGIAVVMNRQVKRIYVGKNALKLAKLNK